ncbi:MAG: hypothetical protein AVDCRST_MAG78-2224, partial [uncultured Rubrobacteraceae bacterium]
GGAGGEDLRREEGRRVFRRFLRRADRASGPRSARLRRGCCDARGGDGREPAFGSLFRVFDPGVDSIIGLIL